VCALVLACGSGTGPVDSGPHAPGTDMQADSDVTAASDARREPEPRAPDLVVPDLAGDVDPGEWAKQYGQACPSDERVGEFMAYAEEGAGKLFPVVTGWVEDRVRAAKVFVAVEQVGYCALMERVNPFCEEVCEKPVPRCGLEGECTPHPVKLSAGTVTLTGLNQPVVMEPNAGTEYEEKEGLTAPLYEVGAPIQLVASGDEVGGFALQGQGAEMLEIPDPHWEISSGSPLTLEWPASDGPGSIHVMLSVDQHAVSPATIFCDAPDTGTLTVAESLVSGLITYHVAGSPSATLFRRTVDSTQVAHGCVEFRVESSVAGTLKVK